MEVGNQARPDPFAGPSHVSPGGGGAKPQFDSAGGTADATSGARLSDELNELSRIQPDTSRDAWYIQNTDSQLLADNKFDMQHVLSGDLKKDGFGSGYHAEFSAGGSARIKPGSSIKYNDNDTYEAQVQIWNPEKIDPVTGQKGLWVEKVTKSGKPQFSTFFPPSWSEARIKFEVAEAFKNKLPNPNGGWIGTTTRGAERPGGIQIQFYWDSKNQRTTFYPIGRSKP